MLVHLPHQFLAGFRFCYRAVFICPSEIFAGLGFRCLEYILLSFDNIWVYVVIQLVFAE